MSAAKRWQTLGKILRRGALLAAVGVPCLYLLLAVALSTQFTAVRISHLLSDYLRQPASIAGLQLTGGGVNIQGLHVAQPPGFAGTEMLVVRSLTVRPVWGALLRGEKRFRAIEVEGLRLDVGKNAGGEWNITRLKHLAAGRKPSAETFISRLVLRNAAIRVDGFGVEKLDLTVNDLATKGSAASGITLDGRDDAGNPFHIEGSVRLGDTLDGRIHLRIPSFSLASFARYLKEGTPLVISEGTGSLDAEAILAGGELNLQGSCTMARLLIRAAGEHLPVGGKLHFSGSYSISRDEARLSAADLTVNDLLHLRASGRVSGVKGGRRQFAADLLLDGFEAGEFFRRLPEKVRRDMRVEGKVAGANAHLEGESRQGLTTAVASLRVGRGEVWRKGALICRGVDAIFSFDRRGTGWGLNGKLKEHGDGGLVEGLSLPVTLRLSRELRLLGVDVPAFSANLGGVPVRGEAHFAKGASVPYRLRLSVPRSSVVTLQRYLFPGRLVLTAGTAAGELVMVGPSPAMLEGKGNISLEGVGGDVGDKKFFLRKGSVTVSRAGVGREAAVEGNITLAGEYAGKRFAAESDYGYRKRGIVLRRGRAAFDRHTLRYAAIGFPFPREARPGHLPLSLSFSGVEVASGDLHAVGGEGSLAVTRLKEEGKSWLEGKGAAAIGALSFRATSLGSATIQLLLGREKGSASLTATPFGGRLAVTIVADPADPARGTSFTAEADGLDAAGVGALAGSGKGWRAAGGRLKGTANGSYSGTAGIRVAGLLAADGLELTSPGGKTAIAGATLRLDAEVNGPSLRVRRATVTLPGGISLEGRGEMARFAAADREGTFTVGVASAPIGKLLDDFVNLLPRALQEASAGGNASLQAKVAVTGRFAAIDGSLLFTDAALDVPSHKMSLTGVHGRIPFSVDTAGNASVRRRDILTFSRDNYPLLVQQMEKPAGGEVLSVERARFGPLEIVSPRFTFRAGDGVTELTSLDVPFFGGHLRGNGSFFLKGAPRYGADILVEEVSLRELCSAFAAIKGYMSGKVDGVVSLRGEGGVVAGMKGFVDIWTRSGRDEKMLVSKEFLQKLAGKNLKGIFFRNDRPYDRGEVNAYLEGGYLTFSVLDISHTNFLGIQDLSVSVAPVSNRISLDHLFQTIREAAARGKPVKGEAPAEPPPQTEFKWQE